MQVIARSALNLRGRPASDWFSDPKLAELANAAASGNVALIDKLAKEGVPIDGMSSQGELTPLVFALAVENYAGSKRLLELGANPNRNVVIDRSKGTLFSFIVMSNNPTLTELLLQFKADPNVVSNADTPLMRAVRHRPIIELLLKYGANVNYDDGYGVTAATTAAALAELDNVKLFLDAGLNVELDSLALTLQSVRYREDLEPRRRELLDILKAKGAKIRYSKNNPSTPQVTHPEYSKADADTDKAADAARRKARGIP
jgi:ankyrin repeat protein